MKNSFSTVCLVSTAFAMFLTINITSPVSNAEEAVATNSSAVGIRNLLSALPEPSMSFSAHDRIINRSVIVTDPYVCPPSMDNGISSPDTFWVSVDMHALAAEQGSSLDDVAGSHKVTDTFFGKEFEIRKGRTIIEFDPMRANNPNAVALDNALNDRIVFNEVFSASQNSGVIVAPFKNKSVYFKFHQIDQIWLQLGLLAVARTP